MIKINRLFLIGVLFCLAVGGAQAANTIYVDVASPNDPGTGTSADPFRRIQDAINFAVSGETVEIRPGTYTGSGNYNLDPNGKSITIRSTNPEDAEIVANTIINPANAGRGFYVHSGEDANCIISGLTITNAYTDEIGAGILCQASSPTIINCYLRDNHAEPEGYGAGAFCIESNSLFVNCIITRNYGYDGGGISIRAGNPRLINCIISNNHAVRYGGGVDCYYQGNPDIVNCSLVGNTAGPSGAGGGISQWDSDVNVKNSIIWANESTNGPQLYLQFQSSIYIGYCDVEGGIIDVCAPDSVITWGSGNIDSEPCFATFDADGDPNLWDLHLRSTDGRWAPAVYSAADLTRNGFVDLQDFAALAQFWFQQGVDLAADFDDNGSVDFLDLQILLNAYLLSSPPQGMWVFDEISSPCLDAGDPNSDWAIEPWPNGKRINMGAFGGTNQASKNGLKADFDVDGYVDFVDFSYLAVNWGLQQNCIEDLNDNGDVDIYDLEEFSVSWLEQD